MRCPRTDIFRRYCRKQEITEQILAQCNKQYNMLTCKYVLKIGQLNELTREKTITTNICTAPISRQVPTNGNP